MSIDQDHRSKDQFAPFFASLDSAIEYATDAAQRSVLFLDVLRQRGNAYREDVAKNAPHVLDYAFELIVDGRTLDRPVNYALVRIIPPTGIAPEPGYRPFVIVDPRAGHGPGIGGFKADSEIGVALKAGHPCYFVGFLPDPITGQTIEDIARTEAIFLERVIALHPESNGRPCVIGNCQAGWAIMMVAALRPELFGPIIIAGSPLSYWAGVHGKNPMRYSGGLLGGSWLTALVSDLGHGKFDGAWLVQNFENQNPANTLWTKPYNLYSKIDTEAPRYLQFERWWGGHVNLNAEEIQFIVDELFIGNNLSRARIHTSDGIAIDLRGIRSPIVVFCSKGDNVTPPQQALGWILDLYENVEEIRSYGQTIVYTIHESIGHLGIFVSSGVARKEHGEFSSNIDLIDTLPPGLYEAVFQKKAADAAHPELVSGEWVMRCEARTLADIRVLGGNDEADERRFATAARISATNLALYRTFLQPIVRTLANPQFSEWLHQWHPLRLQYELFSDTNPLMGAVGAIAEQVRQGRKPVASDNPFLGFQEHISQQIVAALNAWRDVNDAVAERIFLSIYGSPTLQAAAGIDSASLRRAGKSPVHQQFVQAKIAELRAKIGQGGTREGVVRAVLYVGMARASVDERGFELVRRIRLAQRELPHLTLTAFKALVREQFFMLLIDEDAAVEAIASLLPPNAEERHRAFALVKQVLSARGDLSGLAKQRMDRIAHLFDVEASRPETSATAPRTTEQRLRA
jgi:hypothetical protein